MEKKQIPLFKVYMNEKVKDTISEVLMSGFITQGSKVDQFESELSKYFGNNNILTLNSATSGLTLALRLLFEPNVELNWKGMKEGDEVLTPALTCTATNWAILANKLNIKWLDVDEKNSNSDIEDIKKKLSPTTKVIMAMHWGGGPMDLDKLKEIQEYCLEKYGFRPMIIEDCAHAFGAEYKGKKLGNHGNICVYSLQAIKHLTTGDGGLIILPNTTLYERAKLLRWYGIDRNKRNYNRKDFRLENDVVEWGYKFHMNDINATIGLANLPNIDNNLKIHRENAEYYNKELQEIKEVTLLENNKEILSSYWIYSLLVKDKENFIKFMGERGVIVSQVHNRNDIHTCVNMYKTELKNLDNFEKELVCLPVGWWVTPIDRKYIVESIKEFYSSK
jgi:dTDP-4-amino-4,6-dideoxygalactose transaminase